MHKELHSIRVIREYMLQNGIIKQETNNIEDIYQVFKYLAIPFNVRKFNSLYILNYINEFDIDLHEMYVHYASTSNIVGKRQTILTKLSYIFDRFDQDFKELKS